MVEQGNILGDLIVSDRYELLGMCTGNVLVQRNSVLYLYGIVSKSITLEPGSKVFIQGIVGGDIINNGGDIASPEAYLETLLKPLKHPFS
ncbi:hypothetical protein JCM19232_3763 [Vibrio ishigakensis]|uniref:Uncharacterized protein n=1 Tax=Vibrio ishigakensis TaxID=1481914 RepID=A0A0B8P3M4_9VIBR|nr:hypothetical protein JCM19232_3763 [Vibrio ishigakensis]